MKSVVQATVASLVVAVALVFGLPRPAFAGDAASGTVQATLRSKINALSDALSRPADRDALVAFYAARDYAPIWVDDRGPTRAASYAVAELRDAGDWGLDPAQFQLPAVSAPKANGAWTPEQTANAEFEISTAVLNYARQARGGRIEEPERLLSSYLDRRPALPEPATVLAQVTGASHPEEVLRAFHPQHPQFQKLRELYVSLKSKSTDAAAIIIARDGPMIAPGSKSDDVATLRRRFAVAVPAEGADFYDGALVEAVKAFQKSAKLQTDGFVGAKTRKALTADGGNDKAAAVLANMEEWRWMPADLGATHLFVNVPSFSIALVENGQTAVEERVIVGKETTQTPIFSKELTSIVLKPLWNLPDSIKLEKLLDAQRRGSPIENEGYKIKKGNRFVDSWSVDWTTANLSQYTIFQPSGDGNALGDVKFLFPNKHSVYLHDTPSKALFAEQTRLFSHGCIRLRNPLALAQRLLDDDKGEGVFDVKKLIRRGPGSNEINLGTPLPIHIAYFTVWIDDDGEAQFLGDPYGHQQRITLALQQKWKEIDKGADHLAQVDTTQLKAQALKKPGGIGPPMGVTQVFSSEKYEKYRAYERDSVNELMRAALQR